MLSWRSAARWPSVTVKTVAVTKDTLLVPWGSNFDVKVTASPTTYSLTAGQATAAGVGRDGDRGVDGIRVMQRLRDPRPDDGVGVYRGRDEDAARDEHDGRRGHNE